MQFTTHSGEISSTIKGGMTDPAAIPKVPKIYIKPVAVVLWCCGNQDAETCGGPANTTIPAMPFKKWPAWINLWYVIRKYISKWNFKIETWNLD